MSDLTYFYETDTEGNILTDRLGNPVKRKYKPFFEVDIIKAVESEASHDRIIHICEGIIDTKQWQWLALYEQWLAVRDSINAVADAIPPKLDGAGDPIPGQWQGEYTPNALRATIPDQPVRPALVSFEEVYGPYQRLAFVKDRTAKVNEIKVEVDGHIFDGYEEAQSRMARAVVAMDDGEQMAWTLYDNSVVMVSKQTLRNALRASGQAQGALWHRI